MGIRYTVRRGDSLWSLAGRYLGDHTRYQDIGDYHNEHARRNIRAAGQPLIAITDLNRIYVGQVLMIPGRGERPAGAGPKGTRAEAGGTAKTVDLKTEFIMGPARAGGRPPSGNTENGHGPSRFAVPLDLKAEQRPGAPIRYGPYSTPDYTMTGELSGSIVLENMNPDRHRGNWELAISDNENVLSRKLKDQYGQAFLELTADMGMTFDPASGVATVRPRIAAKAGLGPYSFKVQADSPTHFTSAIDLKPIEGSFDLAGRKFKYSSKLSVKVDVLLHPTPKKWDKDVTNPQERPAIYQERASSDKLKKIGVVTTIFVILYVIITKGGVAISQIGDSMSPAMRSPFMFAIDPNDPRLNA